MTVFRLTSYCLNHLSAPREACGTGLSQRWPGRRRGLGQPRFHALLTS